MDEERLKEIAARLREIANEIDAPEAKVDELDK